MSKFAILWLSVMMFCLATALKQLSQPIWTETSETASQKPK
jgi:hypothetical protein